LADQVDALRRLAPDLVALQEVTRTTAPVWPVALASLGLAHCVVGFEQEPAALLDSRRSKGAVLLASRWPLALAAPIEMPWRERGVSVLVAVPFGLIEVHTVHVPNDDTGAKVGIPWLKEETFEAIYRRMGASPGLPKILCGDLNAPKYELEDGTIVVWGRRGRAADAELSVTGGLTAFGLVDTFRSLHGYRATAVSWAAKRGATLFGYRLDHLLASRSLEPVQCTYHWDLVERGVSDHAAIEASFRPGWTGGPASP
jgi:endonuclease/exonuclease/phosphatase family metal-dependent hydrolase